MIGCGSSALRCAVTEGAANYVERGDVLENWCAANPSDLECKVFDE